MDFNNISDLTKYLETAMQDVLQKEIFEAVQNEMVTTINQEVYPAYTPAKGGYKRHKKDGGLTDKSNIRLFKVNGMMIEIRNVRSDNGKNVADIVASGEGYDWTRSEIYNMQPFPRDFYKGTVFRLKNNGKLSRKLKEGLKRHGIVSEVVV